MMPLFDLAIESIWKYEIYGQRKEKIPICEGDIVWISWRTIKVLVGTTTEISLTPFNGFNIPSSSGISDEQHKPIISK